MLEEVASREAWRPPGIGVVRSGSVSALAAASGEARIRATDAACGLGLRDDPGPERHAIRRVPGVGRASAPSSSSATKAVTASRSRPRPCRSASAEASERAGQADARGRRPGPPRSWPGRSARGSRARPGRPASRRRWADRTGPGPAAPAQSARTSVLGGGSNSSSARTAPTTNSTGPTTRVPRLAVGEEGPRPEDRRDRPADVEVVLAQARRPATSIAVGATRPSRPRTRRRAARPAAGPWPAAPAGSSTRSSPVQLARPAEDRLLAVVVPGRDLGGSRRPRRSSRSGRGRPP